LPTRPPMREVGMTSRPCPAPPRKKWPAMKAGQVRQGGIRDGSELVAESHQPGAAPLDGLQRTVLGAGVGAVARVVEVAALQVQAHPLQRAAIGEAVGHLGVDGVFALDVAQGARAVEVADLADEVRTLALVDAG